MIFMLEANLKIASASSKHSLMNGGFIWTYQS
jgi:hypothetical protein